MVRRRSGEDDEISAAVPGRNLYKLVAVSFGLLCIIQATLNISLRLILYTKGSCKLEMELVQLQTSYNNLTEEKNQLQTSYNNLTEEKNQLQTSYEEEKYRLRKNLVDMTNKKDELQRKLEALQFQRCVYFGSSLYCISSEMKSWQQSRDDCLRRGADLIVINSHEEQEFARSFQKRIWIGLTDIEVEGKWKWVDGTPLTTEYWIPLEPSNGLGQENCAEIKNFLIERSWNDELCDSNKFWICEKKLPS